MTFVLSGAAVLTMDAGDRLLPSADIRIDGRAIVAIGEAGTLRNPGEEVIDCADTLVMPGFVNVHTHACAGILRGVSEDVPRGSLGTFYVLPGSDKVTREDYAFAAGIAAHEFLLSGTTCIADRYGFMDRIGPEIEASG